MGSVISYVARPLAVCLVHWLRLGGWFLPLLYALWRNPKWTLIGTAFYLTYLAKAQWWIKFVMALCRFGTPPGFSALVKEQDISPARSYVFSFHPHGILLEGAIYSIALDFEGFAKAFPHIRLTVAVADEIRYLPMYREVLNRRQFGGIYDDCFDVTGTRPEQLRPCSEYACVVQSYWQMAPEKGRKKERQRDDICMLAFLCL
jgi:hypothetical protein